MKIAIIASGFLPVVDGVTVSGLERLRKLSQWGHEVLFFCPDYRPLNHLYPNWEDYTGNILPGVKVVSLKSNGLLGLDIDRNVDFWSYGHLIRELKAFQPELIHVDEPERLFLGFWRTPGVRYARSQKIPCVAFYRTHFIDYIDDFIPLPTGLLSMIKGVFKQLLLSLYHAYDLTLVSSHVTHQRLIEMGFNNAVYKNLLGFNYENFSPQLRRSDFFASQYGLADVDDKVKLIFLGRLMPDKNWQFTLDALDALQGKIDFAKIAIVVAGVGPMEAEIKTRLKAMTPHAHVLGRIPPEEVPALLVNGDIHITTSEKETRGLTILEAFAAGIPVIVPNKGGVTENVRDGWNGFLFTPQDQNDFGKKLLQLIEDPTLRQTMGRNGAACVKSYRWDETVQNLVETWQRLVAS